jgi:hypothetical protein
MWCSALGSQRWYYVGGWCVLSKAGWPRRQVHRPWGASASGQESSKASSVLFGNALLKGERVG